MRLQLPLITRLPMGTVAAACRTFSVTCSKTPPPNTGLICSTSTVKYAQVSENVCGLHVIGHTADIDFCFFKYLTTRSEDRRGDGGKESQTDQEARNEAGQTRSAGPGPNSVPASGPLSLPKRGPSILPTQHGADCPIGTATGGGLQRAPSPNSGPRAHRPHRVLSQHHPQRPAHGQAQLRGDSHVHESRKTQQLLSRSTPGSRRCSSRGRAQSATADAPSSATFSSSV